MSFPFQLTKVKRLQGGDINDVFLCESEFGPSVLKTNNQQLPQIFQKEAEGLDAMRTSNSFIIPKVFAVGKEANNQFLLLEYLEKSAPNSWKKFGEHLAKMHRQTNEHFGFKSWNYIGSLHQPNQKENKAIDFLINQRLEPQFTLASQNGFSFSGIQSLYKVAEKLIPDEQTALIHGDLWNGNYLSTKNGYALIDPAVSYGIREMDLAMMRLFGGFPEEVFDTYHHCFPSAPGLEERIPIYQLYYILVHVNLFGGSYVSRAQSIINQYV